MECLQVLRDIVTKSCAYARAHFSSLAHADTHTQTRTCVLVGASSPHSIALMVQSVLNCSVLDCSDDAICTTQATRLDDGVAVTATALHSSSLLDVLKMVSNVIDFFQGIAPSAWEQTTRDLFATQIADCITHLLSRYSELLLVRDPPTHHDSS